MRHPDPAAFRRAMSRFTTGVTVITSRNPDGQIAAMTANSFTSISLAPPTVVVSVMTGRTLSAIESSRRFGVNVLPASARDLSNHFAGKRVPGLTPDFEDVDGMPKLVGALAYFDCAVERSMVVADHTLLIGAVQACSHGEAPPLIFYSSQYHDLGAAAGL